MSDEHLDDIVLENSDVNLDGDYMDFNEDSPQSPTFLQTSDQSLIVGKTHFANSCSRDNENT
ncbi:21050_t:CDS:2, partial [Gigaspora rosea]